MPGHWADSLLRDELRLLAKAAVEMWEETGDETAEYLSERQREVLSKARDLYYGESRIQRLHNQGDPTGEVRELSDKIINEMKAEGKWR